ncbi:hypothetical protein J4Q44_G00008800 [Coregonus suidteri]|uniref:Uncharacterized protein n=1 Tax=Coregonus suidteri TaxID=861788 RepID=A0AAN8MJX6_9TELE
MHRFCDTIGRETPVGEVWGVIKRMSGVRREWDYPVLTSGEDVAVTDEEKAEMMAKAFVQVHSSANLSEGQRGRENTREEHPGVLDRREDVNDALNAPFTRAEVKRAIGKAGLTSPGKDEVCYVMLGHLSDEAMDKVLVLYNRVWEEGKLPGSWKEAVVVTIRKPRKDPTKPTSYRPIALTSHVCNYGEQRASIATSEWVQEG